MKKYKTVIAKESRSNRDDCGKPRLVQQKRDRHASLAMTVTFNTLDKLI